MGIETAIVVGALGVANSVGKYNQSKSAARQTAKEGAIEAENRKTEIQKLAATQRVSFLQAGVELEGTPQNVIQDTYNTGIADIQAVKSSYKQKVKNIMVAARSELIGGLASSVISGVAAYGMAGGGSLFGSGAIESGGVTSSATVNGVYQGSMTEYF